jgi:hypothetical protein
MHRTWNLEGGKFAVKLKGDNMESLELESSDAEGVGLEGAQLDRLRVVKSWRRVMRG